MGLLRYGTSSWSEESWVGAFYPPGTKPGEFLTHYATQFDTVEADVTYYRIPDPKMVRGWAEKTPDHFLLSAKFPRSIVHGGEGATPAPDVLLRTTKLDRDCDQFLKAMDGLGQKCGPLVLQFPYFNRKTIASSAVFLDRLQPFLAGLPRRFRYAVEIRNKTWIGPELLDLLREHSIALVWVDLVYMPGPKELAQKGDLLTADFAYLRLIGDRKAVDEASGGSFDRVVLDQSERLREWAPLVSASLGRVPETFAYANNHYAGHGPATIRELAELVGAREAEAAPARPKKPPKR